LRWIFGEIRTVSAVLRTQSNLDIDVEDTALLTLGFGGDESSGLIASLDMDFVRRDTTRTCTAIGERGTLRWDGIRGTVELFDAADNAWSNMLTVQTQPDDTYIEEWRHFLDCIEHGGTPSPNGEDGLAVLNVIDAARRASASGCTATVTAGPAGLGS
jgi:predicted dehydrogenase